MFKLNTKFEADSLLYSLSHFECDSHTSTHAHSTVSTAPLTSTVKSSLFTHVHSSPLSLAARWHPCCANRSHYINHGWTFSGQTSSREASRKAPRVLAYLVGVSFRCDVSAKDEAQKEFSV